MLLIVTDVHARFDLIDRQLAHGIAQVAGPGRPSGPPRVSPAAPTGSGREPAPATAPPAAPGDEAAGIDGVLVLGDFGCYRDRLAAHFERHPAGFQRPVWFIEGNHEDFAEFDDLVDEHRHRFTHLPRGTVHRLGGLRFLCLGGSAYMDAHNTPAAAEIRERDICRCMQHAPDAVDVIISHDCPRGIGVPNSPGFEHYGPPGFAGGERLVARFRPRLWLFGHHHQWFDRTIDGTRFCGLPQVWEGYGLLAPDASFTAVPHRLDPELTRWERTLAWLRHLFP